MIDKNNEADIQDFRCRLLRWFAENQRPLPWRESYEPYQVWISEIMGQQTQMDRVAQYFCRWVAQFPDLASVADASEQKILKAWEGLGYYSRARNIQRAARQLLAAGYGDVPSDYTTLLALPGVGPYTAAAIVSIAFNQPVALRDANVERVFARLADIDSPLKQAPTRKYLDALAQTLLDPVSPRLYNQALMELGALVCTPKKPACAACPVQMHCRAFKADTVEFRPLPSDKQKKIEIVMACGILHHQGRIFVQQRLADDIWGGLWEFPGGRLEEGESPLAAAKREVAEETGWQVRQLDPFKTVVHHYTRYRVTLHAFLGRLDSSPPAPRLTAAQQYAWVAPAGLSDYPYPAGHRMLVEALQGTFFPEIG
ncbi:A/G-specific adenine glycosylase [uncultured Vibrio sp.]|uniref:A/G-specific adenine glycosylase n=1 Tax=uncultured Vibrio sp. TaxID=114054 RepID=UPI002AA94DC7|nr:A/G-specific adenine glycosylase [uncultured Vibrio sp.]